MAGEFDHMKVHFNVSRKPLLFGEVPLVVLWVNGAAYFMGTRVAAQLSELLACSAAGGDCGICPSCRQAAGQLEAQ
jgi:hypothetical protein